MATLNGKLTEAEPHYAWRCFHCDEVFTDRRSAADHFGTREDCEPACQIKLGAERSMLTALRRAEQDAADAWFRLQNESGEAAQAYYAQNARHQEQLRIAEELGYERGLRDGRSARQVVTSFVYPPIPIREFDWCAYFAGDEELGRYGYGKTEAAAISDLLDNYGEDE